VTFSPASGPGILSLAAGPAVRSTRIIRWETLVGYEPAVRIGIVCPPGGSAMRFGCGESSTCGERKSGAENNRSGEPELSGPEHCYLLSDQSVVLAAKWDGQTYWLNHHAL
jgi:hypothetical protein